MTEFLLSNILILSGLAFLSAIILYFVSQKFAIKQDPIFEAIYNDGGDTIYLCDQIEDKKNSNDVTTKLAIENAIYNLDERERYILDI